MTDAKELWMFKLGDDIKIGHTSEPNMIYIERSGEGGFFNEREFIEMVHKFVSERL
jgi:hypothetical protein